MEVKDEDDQFDDFADFTSFNEQLNVNEDDEWSNNFTSAPSSAPPVAPPALPSSDSPSAVNFTLGDENVDVIDVGETIAEDSQKVKEENFDNATVAEEQNEDDDGFDDFTDFQDFQQTTAETNVEETSAPSAAPLCTTYQNKMSIIEAFPSQIDQERLDVDYPLHSKYSTEVLHLNNSNLWSQLTNNEDDSRYSQLKWSSTHSFTILLKSLKIDKEWGFSYMPKFMSNLTLLKPTPIDDLQTSPSSATNKQTISKENQLPSTSDFECNFLSSPSPTSATTSANSTISTMNSNNNSNFNSINDYDLTYLISKEINQQQQPNGNISKTIKLTSLEEELLGPDLNNLTGESTSKQLVNPIEKLLNTSETSYVPNLTKLRPSSLSPEANRILDELPIISFIRASVLMFPLKDLNDKS